MARTREDLHEILVDILGSRNVYFQPPESLKLKYPCILYERDDIWTDYADDGHYINYKKYTVTVVDADPDSEIPDKLNRLPLCEFDRHYASDYLNHDVFTLYY